MSETVKQKLRPKLRIVILGLQALMPYGLHLAIQSGHRPLGMAAAAVFSVSMLVLVWLG